MERDDPYRQVGKNWNVYYPRRPEPVELRALISQSELFDKVPAPFLRGFFFSYNDFRIIRATKMAAAYVGKTPQQIVTAGTPGILDAIPQTQRNKTLSNILAIAGEMNSFAPQIAGSLVSNLVNLSVNFENQPARRVLIQLVPVTLAEDGQPVLGMMLMHDIGAFMRPGVWWCRHTAGNHVRYYEPDSDTVSHKDILSVRELEILKLLKEGMTSKQIGAALFVSSNTVDNHRRNMLQRTGAVDTSALIHLAELINML